MSNTPLEEILESRPGYQPVGGGVSPAAAPIAGPTDAGADSFPSDTGAQLSEPAGDASPDRNPGNAHWTYSALKSERSKRQAFQRRMQELEAENQALMAAQQDAVSDSGSNGEFWSAPEATVRHLQEEIRDLRMEASLDRNRSKHGAEAVAELEAALMVGMQMNHPDMLALRDAVNGSKDPAGTAMDWYRQLSPNDPISVTMGNYRRQQELQQVRHRTTVFPSNLAGARNVGSRSGPAWSGPPSLKDIFARSPRGKGG